MQNLTRSHKSLRIVWLQIALLVAATLLPALATTTRVDAAQMDDRNVTISTSQASATGVEWDFGFDLQTADQVEGIRLLFCTTPLGACTAPPGLDVDGDDGSTTSTIDGQTGFPANATSFTKHITNAGECTVATNPDNEFCLTRTEATSATPGTTDGTPDTTLDLGGIVNASGSQVNSVYVRITLYNDPVTFITGNITDDGVVAAAIVNQITITARVQEDLEFCVGDTETVAATTDDCTDVSGNDIDLGVLSSSVTVASAVDSAAFAMVRTNATGGVTVVYFADNGNGNSDGHLAKAGETCSGSSTTDGCINSVGTTEAAIVGGVENFGMTITSVDATGSATPTANLIRDVQYDNGTGYAFDGTSTTDQIASSTTVIDDEMLVIDFAATASLTTPTGVYDTTLTFIATPTF